MQGLPCRVSLAGSPLQSLPCRVSLERVSLPGRLWYTHMGRGSIRIWAGARRATHLAKDGGHHPPQARAHQRVHLQTRLIRSASTSPAISCQLLCCVSRPPFLDEPVNRARAPLSRVSFCVSRPPFLDEAVNRARHRYLVSARTRHSIAAVSCQPTRVAGSGFGRADKFILGLALSRE